MKINKSGVAIIEVIIGIFIFTIGLVSIYLTISSSINLNDYNKNQIIASNLAREGLELVKNLRDSNYVNLHRWDSLNPNLTSGFSNSSNLIQTGVYYKVRTGFDASVAGFTVKLIPISGFKEGPEFINTDMKNYELCLNATNKYVYNCVAAGNKSTRFYRYVKFEDLKYKDSSGNIVTVNDAYKVISKVIWYNRGYHETSLTTIIADYKRL